MHDLIEDLRFGWRMLRRSPVATAAAILTLALGIGATTSMFSITRAVLLRPFPYPESERPAVMVQRDGLGNEVSVNRMDFEDLRRESRAVEAMALYRGGSITLGGEGDPVRLLGLEATASMLDTLGLTPVLGRGFTPEDDTKAAEPSVLLGHDFWQQRFGGDPQVLGREIRLDAESYTIIGVLPPALGGETLKWYDSGDVWLPFGRSLSDLPPNRGYGAGHLALVRFRSGESL
ncbi:MAG: ABC transporter permease, partial [Acidobacteria bacterium]|nr:ABC transporter permease [Acidobacteriota bacterium]